MDLNQKKKLGFVTLGCQMNKHDSEWIAGVFSSEYDVTVEHEEADLLIINTCAVRDKAEQKFSSFLGRLKPLKARKKDMVIGVAGCMAQEHGEALAKKEPMVDLVFGPRTISKAPVMLRRFMETGKSQVDISDHGDYDEYPMVRETSVNGWISIMQGCDNFCSYCIVPHVRGRERSRRPESIVAEARCLAEEGFKEITLLGQNVNSYGKGLGGEVDFPRLLEMVNEVEGVERIRFVTSHPKDLSIRLVEAMARLEKVCPSLHLPLQAGSSRVLHSMNRGYTPKEYFEKIDLLREKVEGIALTSDIIVGYPGETEDDFQETEKAIALARFDNIFLFKYSPRPGTAAFKLEGMVDDITAGQRFLRIMAAQEKVSREIYNGWVGKTVPILVEGPSKKDPSKATGRTPQNLLVHFHSNMEYTGRIIHVKITGAGRYSLTGALV